MKVRCKKIYDEEREITEVGSHDQTLTVGKEYIVLTVYMQDKDTCFRFEGDDGSLMMFDASYFDVVSSYIPSNWEITFKEYDKKSYYKHYLNLAPKKWNEARYHSGNGFYEEIIEEDGPLEKWRTYPEDMISDVVKLYLQETEIIYREEEEYQKKQKKLLGVNNTPSF